MVAKSSGIIEMLLLPSFSLLPISTVILEYNGPLSALLGYNRRLPSTRQEDVSETLLLLLEWRTIETDCLSSSARRRKVLEERKRRKAIEKGEMAAEPGSDKQAPISSSAEKAQTNHIEAIPKEAPPAYEQAVMRS